MSYFHPHSHYHLIRMKEMGRIYWCHGVGALGVSIAALFIPIYLLKIGFSFNEVLIYLLLQQVFAVLVQWPVSTLMGYIRPHYMLAIGSFWFVVLLGMLITMETYSWPLALAAFVWALNRTFYWTAFHYCFSLARKHHHAGTQIAGINALVVLATTIAPAIGGIVATLFGINYTYVAAIVLMIIAALPVVVSSNGPQSVKLRMTWQEFKRVKRDLTANLFNGMALAAEQNIWPLFVFIIITSYAGIGILTSVIALAGIATALYVGRSEEKKGEYYYIKEGVFLYSISGVLRGLAQNGLHIFGFNLATGIARSLYITPYLNRYYENSDGRYRLGYITTIECAFAVGGALYLSGLLILSTFLPAETILTIGLVTSAAFIWGARLIR